MRILVICAVLLTGGGCGTLYNTETVKVGPTPTPDTYRIYGGVLHDLEEVANCTGDTMTNPETGKVAAYPLAMGLLALDLPLSLIADTLTLPLTVRATIDGSRDSAALTDHVTVPPANPLGDENAAPPMTFDRIHEGIE